MKFEDSSIKISGKNQFQGDTAIGRGAKIIKNYNKTTTYEGNLTNNQLLESLSVFLIEKFGEKKPIVVGIILLIVGLINAITGFKLTLGNRELLWGIFSNISQQYSILILVVGFLVIILGISILILVQYKYDSQCPNPLCKKHYGLIESRNPIINEVKAHDGLKRTTKRFYKCKFCQQDYNPHAITETIPYKN